MVGSGGRPLNRSARVTFDSSSDVVMSCEPRRALLFEAALERLAQAGREFLRLVAPGGLIGGGDDCPQIAEADFLDDRGRGLGAIAPVGFADPRMELVSERHQRIGVDLRRALGARLVLLSDRGSHRGQAAAKELFGDRSFLV